MAWFNKIQKNLQNHRSGLERNVYDAASGRQQMWSPAYSRCESSCRHCESCSFPIATQARIVPRRRHREKTWSCLETFGFCFGAAQATHRPSCRGRESFRMLDLLVFFAHTNAPHKSNNQDPSCRSPLRLTRTISSQLPMDVSRQLQISSSAHWIKIANTGHI